mmetsp:Transcript_15404/g.37539  ORF Transcript_15404/g.37539 Transcript_15404/m.37539 type:complete len:336 (+) Transcript_15404:1476-2483(+)
MLTPSRPDSRIHQCRVCGWRGAGEVHSLREMMYRTDEAFDYWLCAQCRCLQIQDLPTDLARHYPPGYYSQRDRVDPATPTGIKGLLVRWYCRSQALRPGSVGTVLLQSVLPMPTDFVEIGNYLRHARLRSATERILDVGCGASPHRLTAMKRCGFGAVEGLDPFIASDTVFHGVPVRKRTIDEATGEFGLVMFHHSLEHVPDPLASMRKAAQLLRPGGCCLVRVPVFDTYLWRTFGSRWVELDPPRHLYLFSRESMRQLALRCGLTVEHVEFDSEPWEIEGSVQAAAQDPVRASAGGHAAPVPHAAQDRQETLELVRQLNAVGDAGRACFYLRKP